MKSVLIALLGSMALLAQGPVPRPAPELKIVQASGKTTTLSSFRGRVVLLAFISTECPHCQRVSGVFEQLSHEFTGKVQVTEVAFNENADAAAFANRFGLSFPVGVSNTDAAHDFLGIPRGLRLGTPQVVAIDKAGVIRAQSERPGTPLLQTHDFLRDLLRSMEVR